MATFTYPTSASLRAIEPEKLERLQEGRLGFDILPIDTATTFDVEWEQRDNFKGLQQLRGLNGEPTRVNRVGAKRYRMTPGVYGEFIALDERELTTRRKWATWDAPVDVTDLVTEAQDQLLVRRLDRIETIIWSLLTTGTFSVADVTGVVQHTDTYSLQTFTSSVAWSTPATSTPLADFRAVKLLQRGKGVMFDASATAYGNQVTINRMLSNTNANDVAGRRTSGLATLDNLAQVNTLLLGDGLPNIKIYEEGYYDEAGSFNLFIPDGKLVIVGKRPTGQSIGNYMMTLNANNPNMEAEAYTRVIDDENRIPRMIEVHDGHNGGPALYYPGSLVMMNV